MLKIRRFNAQDESFQEEFASFLTANIEPSTDVSTVVQAIIADIRTNGDEALQKYTLEFDRLEVSSVGDLEFSENEIQSALHSITRVQRDALELAESRIREYAQHQCLQSWEYTDALGNRLGQRVCPLNRVGIYVPGGTAAYPSSVLMNAIPAKVAGVSEIVMVAPTPDGSCNQMVLAAAAIVGVDRVFRVGGAQAIAALAYGTDLIPQVDKIVGPGNIYVATAKRLVFGKVGIDMIAGPSEVLIICDESANPDWIAMDLFSQAEHDALARATLISNSEDFLEQVQQAMERLLPTLERAEIAQQSLQNFGSMIHVASLNEAVEISNLVAPEHLELSVSNPDDLLTKIRHAGAIFMGHNSPEVFGDYCAGPNHVLPTSTTARFFSPLGVYDFQKRSTVLNCSAEGAIKLSEVAATLAYSEGLTAHAQSAEFRRQLSKKR